MAKGALFTSTVAQETHAGLKNPAWLATIYTMGKRERRRFKTKGEAEAWVASRKVEVEKVGVQAKGLTRAELNDAIDARNRLDGSSLLDAVEELLLVRDALGIGATLRKSLEEVEEARRLLGRRASILSAVKFYIQHHPTGDAVTLGEAVEEYLAAPRRGGTSPAHVKGLRSHLAILRDTFGESIPLASIMRADIEAFMESKAKERKWSPVTFNAWRVTMKGFFGFAYDKHGLGPSPAAKLERRAVKSGAIQYNTPEEVEKILRAAEELDGGRYAAAVAILFFAGVRPAELVGQYALRNDDGTPGGEILGGLTWNRVDVDGEISLDYTKTNQRRTIPISANLKAWLDRYGQERGRVVANPTAWRRARARIEKASGVKWGADWARHSFATYHYALHKNREALESAMGHTQGGSVVLERHYKGLEPRRAAERFWNILPRLDGCS